MRPPLGYQFLADFTLPFEKWDSLETLGFANGHVQLTGYMRLRPRDPVTDFLARAHEEALTAAYGAERMDEILSTNVHHGSGSSIRVSRCSRRCNSSARCARSVPTRP